MSPSRACVAAFAGLALAGMPAGAGNSDRVEGRERAVYRWTGPAPDGFANNGFMQRVAPGGPSTEISIETDFSPLGSRVPWPVPARRGADGIAVHRVIGSEGDRLAAGSRTLYEAALRILSEVKRRMRYDAAGTSEPDAALAAGRGNCVAFASLAIRWLGGAGIAARPVTGVYLPRAQSRIELSGGALHRFIEIHFPDRGWVFTDPNFTFGAVTSEYLYLGPAGADYSRYLGVSIERTALESGLAVEPRGGELFYSRANVRDRLLERPAPAISVPLNPDGSL